MTVTNTNNRTQLEVSGYDYDFTFKIFDETHIKVYGVDENDDLTLLTLDTDYTVTISEVTEGGTVQTGSVVEDVWTPAEPEDYVSILMVRSMPLTQSADIPVRGGFNESTIETALDTAIMLIQQLSDAIDYSADSDPEAVASAAASATAAAAAQLAAETAQTAAELAETNAETAETNAEATADAAVAEALDTVTGHDHDGTDSKKVLLANIDTTGLTDLHVIYNNGGTLEGKALASEDLAVAGDVPASTTGAIAGWICDTERTLSVTEAYTKVKEMAVPRGGELRIKFFVKAGDTPDAAARIYRNGVAVGTVQIVTDTSYHEFSEDIDGWTAGDLLQLYAFVNSGGTVLVKELRVYEEAPTGHYHTTYDQDVAP